MHKYISGALGAAVLVGVCSAMAPAASAAGGTVSGSITALGKTCSWTNATTTAEPPSTLTIESNTINRPGGNLSCSSGVTATLNNNPHVSFNDAAGTATANAINASVTYAGIACTYLATNATLTRSGSTRDYSGSATAPKTGGSFFCPSSVSLSTTLDFV